MTATPPFNHWYDSVPPSLAEATTDRVTDWPYVRLAAAGWDEIVGTAATRVVVAEAWALATESV